MCVQDKLNAAIAVDNESRYKRTGGEDTTDKINRQIKWHNLFSNTDNVRVRSIGAAHNTPFDRLCGKSQVKLSALRSSLSLIGRKSQSFPIRILSMHSLSRKSSALPARRTISLLFSLLAHFIRRLYASGCDCSVFYWHIRSKRRHILHSRNSVNVQCALNDSETGFSRRCFWCGANRQIPCGAQVPICERAAIKLRYKWLCMAGLSISRSFWRIMAEMQERAGGNRLTEPKRFVDSHIKLKLHICQISHLVAAIR